MKLATNCVSGFSVDVERRRFLHDPAAIHYRHNIGHGQRFELIVGDIKRGDAEALDKLAQFEPRIFPKFCIEIRQWLVEQQHFWLADERPRQGQTLLLSAA